MNTTGSWTGRGPELLERALESVDAIGDDHSRSMALAAVADKLEGQFRLQEKFLKSSFNKS